MRKILFRGKRVGNGEWVYGDYGRYAGTHGIENVISEIDLNNLSEGNVYEVDCKTVGQYTGLNDKNGNMIFEGDIFIDPDYPDTVYQVDYVDGAFVAKERTTNEQSFLRDFVVFGEPEVEVIGNIHDNPELLEVEK